MKAKPQYNYNPPSFSHSSLGLSEDVSFNRISTGGTSTGGVPTAGNGDTIISKHIYVHVPPPETEKVYQKQITSLIPPQKHYKIIFIKAPSYQTQSPTVISKQALSQEKTIVYVLVKKPDDVQDVAIPTVAPTLPSKPEVYFIKYKAQELTGVGLPHVAPEAVQLLIQ